MDTVRRVTDAQPLQRRGDEAGACRHAARERLCETG